ncbi:MAG: stage II sporulation protein E (SpoIIE) [Acidobacteria bacterium]|nr:MAG: stage II sporulation protein E (SpoIIE) [Acidobacteriota bacterium]PYV06791.1 MAG: stage II sporulation protein E (SpoIIE) [Acidobacteriota bacterium]PYV28801.1 MAG: stage II sporulation protein E (SpoIIE) [Acidobacteriota bacterium]
MEKIERAAIEWGAAEFTLPGQTLCGDLCVVKNFDDGWLMGAVDGLGHGQHAAAAARAAIEVLEGHPEESLTSLVYRCHARLRSTRGAVMSLASFNARHSTMSWISVGNVAGVLLHRQAMLPRGESLLLRPGVVGAELPTLYAPVLPVARGDVLILATDGVRSGFGDYADLDEPPQSIADRILARYKRGTDDALVVVARFVNNGNEIHPR